MATNMVCQRWRSRRDSYRPAGEPIQTWRYEVAAIPDDTTAKTFVLANHYAHSFPAARFRFGIYRAGQLQGVAVFSVPMNNAAITNALPCSADEGVELGRLVLLDEVPSNGETWFIARCFERLKAEGLAGVISFSDPVPRPDATGRIIFPGHIGIVYQASNAVFLGRSKARALRLLPDGTLLSDRAITKLRNGHKGWEYVRDLLILHGADRPADEDLKAWTAHWLTQLTRRLPHNGCYKYAWGLNRTMRRHLPVSKPYPKQRDLLQAK